MPTYKNNGSSNVILKNKQGNQVILSPGETLETYYFNNNSDLVKIADTPFWNRVVAKTNITLSSTAQDVAIDLTADYVAIFQISDTVTAYIQSESNTPAELTDWSSDDPIILIPAKGRFNKLVVKGVGTCVICQYINA
jgi:hypothetical protein